MSKHTPGPWGVDQGYIVSKHYPDGEWPIIAKRTNQSILPENWEADARLMAAAPELLIALKQVTDAFARYLAGSETKSFEITQARTAIRKAEKA